MTRPPSEAVEGQNSHHLQRSSDPATTRCHVGSSLAPDVSDPLVGHRATPWCVLLARRYYPGPDAITRQRVSRSSAAGRF